MTAVGLDLRARARARARADAEASVACRHCGQPAPAASGFCCPGCAAAFHTIQTLGLGRYYAARVLDPTARPPKPEAAEDWDFERYVARADDRCTLTLAVDGLQCGACVWLIESALARAPDVLAARVNMTTRRLRLTWRGPAARARDLVGIVTDLGYRLVPFNPRALMAADDRTGRRLTRALAVAGFAAGNVMLLSIGTWAGLAQGMGPGTRALMHWVSALIAMPAIAYAGQPFFASALAALRRGRSNMDVPISIGVALVTTMSLVESFRGGTHTYFDSAITLLFFLLLGRLLDHRARGQARATAEQLLTLRLAEVAVLAADGTAQRRGADTVVPGDLLLVGMGERIGADGVVERGSASLDTSLVTGESLPVAAQPGTAVFAGTLNLGAPIVVRATATAERTLLAECVRLIEAAEARRGRFVVLADRVARAYAPTVHLCAATTFLVWHLALHRPFADSLLAASAVLIITCPCALALAVPAVQVIATSGLFRRGVLLKSATALERLSEIDTVVFDKTGTLTSPTPALVPSDTWNATALATAGSLASGSRHPLARALVQGAGPTRPPEGLVEHPGEGISLRLMCGEIRLGSRAFCGVDADTGSGGLPPEGVDGRDKRDHDGAGAPELWLARPGRAPVCFTFAETLRPDAAVMVQRLRAAGLKLRILSGDRASVVAGVAGRLGIENWRAEISPVRKVELIEELRAEGRRVLVVGDGLNDGPSLAAAHVSASPSTAADISQTVSDAVFQGASLLPIADLVSTARRARRLMRQNLIFSICYNAVMLPLAMCGLVTPWLAAAAMSSSSLLVTLNSFRVRQAGAR